MKKKTKTKIRGPILYEDEMIVVACGFRFINFEGMEMDSNFND